MKQANSKDVFISCATVNNVKNEREENKLRLDSLNLKALNLSSLHKTSRRIHY